jgi:hypothetical protein
MSRLRRESAWEDEGLLLWRNVQRLAVEAGLDSAGKSPLFQNMLK